MKQSEKIAVVSPYFWGSFLCSHPKERSCSMGPSSYLPTVLALSPSPVSCNDHPPVYSIGPTEQRCLFFLSVDGFDASVAIAIGDVPLLWVCGGT